MKTVKKILALGITSLALLGLWLPGAAGLIAVGGCGGGKPTPGAPTANAGPDQTVIEKTLVTLDGSASTGVTSYAWTLTKPAGSAAALAGETTVNPTLTPDVTGSYQATLTINGDAALTDSVTITATDEAASFVIPEGSAISTRTRYGKTEFVVDLEAAGATLQLVEDGAAALKMKDSDAAVYLWEQVDGPAATIVDGASVTINFTAPELAAMQNKSDRFKWQLLPVSRQDTQMVFKVTKTLGESSTSKLVSIFLQDNKEEIHTSSGLANVPVGAAVYLNGPEESEEATAPGEITDWTWTLTSRPGGSSAAFADTGTDTSNLQMPRFTPDVPGLYDLAYSSTTSCVASTSVSTINCPGTITISAGDYSGVGTIGGASPSGAQCGTCHDGVPLSGLDDKVAAWADTYHAVALKDNYSDPQLEYYTVGYNPHANSLGFDDLMEAAGLSALAATYDTLLADYSSVAKLANVQCENCHGPGSEHQGAPVGTAASFSQTGVCGQCHIEEAQWAHSTKNSDEDIQSWVGTSATSRCSRCHNAMGFVIHLETGTYVPGTAPQADTGAFPGITCVACHDPHDNTNPNQLRKYGDASVAGDTVSAGKAAICYECHDGWYTFTNGETNNCDSNRDGTNDTSCVTVYQSATQGGTRSPFHYASQGMMLEGKGILKDLGDDGAPDFTPDENSFHTSDSFILSVVTGNADLPSTNNKCVTCHMYEGPALGEAGHNEIGGHAFDPVAEDGTENVPACTVCHGDKISEANGGYNRRARADYDGDGDIEGIQDEIKGLMLNLTNIMLKVDKVTDEKCRILSGGTTESGGVITVGSLSVGSWSSSNGNTAKCSDAALTMKTKKRWWNLACDVAESAGYANCTDPNDTWAEKTEEQQKNNMVALAAYANYQFIYGDHSFGIHNAAYAIQILQGTYTAVGRHFNMKEDGSPISTEGDPVKKAAAIAAWSYKSAYPAATIR